MSTANAALAGLYQAHANELHGFARRRAGRQEAEDVVQDPTSISSSEVTPRLSNTRAPTSFALPPIWRWIWRARLRSVCVTRTRALEHDCNAEAPASPEAAAGGAMELRRLQASLAELPPLCRDAFLLNRIEDLTHAEIAARLGVSGAHD